MVVLDISAWSSAATNATLPMLWIDIPGMCREAKMESKGTIGDHWGKGDVYALILSALEKAGK
jgi:hypothetical protein